MKPSVLPIYTPDNEPYLGRQNLFAFDKTIIAGLQINGKIAPYTHRIADKSDLQLAACQIIPQGISIALSIRELIRQGYLFGALVLMRSLVERAVTILYLFQNQKQVDVWKRGWNYKERPTLSQMLSAIGKDKFPSIGREITPFYNSLTHGDPDSSIWNLVEMNDGNVGHGVSKIVDNPSLCDRVALDGATWLSILIAMADAVFPDSEQFKK